MRIGLSKNIFGGVSLGFIPVRGAFSFCRTDSAAGAATLVGNVKDGAYSDLSGQVLFPSFTLPAKATLIYCSIEIITEFDVLFNMYVGLADGTKFTSDTPSQPVGIMDYQFVKNAYTYSDTADVVVSVYPTAGGSFPALAVGLMIVCYVYIMVS